jgi:hypothetical protein
LSSPKHIAYLMATRYYGEEESKLNTSQMKSLIRVFHVKKICLLRWHPQTELLEVGWKHKNGGIVHRWIGKNGKFVR